MVYLQVAAFLIYNTEIINTINTILISEQKIAMNIILKTENQHFAISEAYGKFPCITQYLVSGLAFY